MEEPVPQCNHKWVHYQPLTGESYTCCANAGCGITYQDYLVEEAKKTVPTKKNHPDAVWEGTVADWFALSRGFEDGHVAAEDTPKPQPKKGWQPIEMAYYLNPYKTIEAPPKEEKKEQVCPIVLQTTQRPVRRQGYAVTKPSGDLVKDALDAGDALRYLTYGYKAWDKDYKDDAPPESKL